MEKFEIRRGKAEIKVDAVDTVYALKEKIIAEMRSEDL